MINVNEMLPYFSLKDHKGNEVCSEHFKGKKLLLSFHPLAYTPVCADQMKALEENFSFFEKNNTAVLGISIDSTYSKNAWAKQLGIEKLPLVSDFWPHAGLAVKLGIFRGNDGITERANILVGSDGRVAWTKLYDVPELPDIAEVKKAVEGL